MSDVIIICFPLSNNANTFKGFNSGLNLMSYMTLASGWNVILFQIPNLAIIVKLCNNAFSDWASSSAIFSSHLLFHLIPSHFNLLFPKVHPLVVLSVTVHWRRLETCEAMEPPESISRAIPVLSFWTLFLITGNLWGENLRWIKLVAVPWSQCPD